MTASVFWRFATADDAVAAATTLRAIGYRTLEAYTPYEVKELEPLLAVRRSRISRAALAGGAFGAALAYAILWFCNAYDFPIDVGGRPLNSIPADVPIIFETTVLVSALSIFFGFLFRSGLPRLHRSVFEIEGFERVSIDEYWVGIDERELDGAGYGRARAALGHVVGDVEPGSR